MTSLTPDCTRCTTCQKLAGTFTCCGCSRSFCLRHVMDHRQALAQQMDEEIVLFHDQLYENCCQYMESCSCHSLTKAVDSWEKESIEKIHQLADDIRKRLALSMKNHFESVKSSLDSLSQQITKAREADEYFESNIDEWKKELCRLQQELEVPPKINLHKENDQISFIPKFFLQDQTLSTEIFEKVLGDANIESSGQVIKHKDCSSHAPIRGKTEYSYGQHCIRFFIEHLRASVKWILFGIASKSSPFSYEDIYGAPWSCGWAGNDKVLLNGKCHDGLNGYKTDMEENDTLNLFIDCDKRKIRLTNERTKSVHELDIDINKCPFPWQLSLNLYAANDCVRIIP